MPEPVPTAPTPAAPRPDLWSRLPDPLPLRSALPLAALLTALATLAAHALLAWLPPQALSLVYLPVVLLAAVGYGLSTGIAAAIASFLAFNFFFIPPTYTFRISDPQDLLALVVFFAVALLTGSLAGRMREVADDARRRASALHGLNTLAAELSAATSESTALAALTAAAAATVRGQAVLLAPDGDTLRMLQAEPKDLDIGSADLQAARQTARTRATTYASAPGWPGARYDFRALVTGGRLVGLLGVRPGPERTTHPEDEATLDTMLQHAAIAIARTRMERESLAARAEAEQERLRSTLLSSLSHDLRTPLAAILGAVTSLRELGERMDEATRADLLAAIEEEAARLSLFVANLLDMTRLEGGSPDITRDWIDAADSVQSAVARAQRLFPGRSVETATGDNLPLVRGDATLLEHVVFNLIDNAMKYAPTANAIRISLRRQGEYVVIAVADDGPGIALDMLPRVFDKHFRAVPSDRGVPGTGLGLTICRRVVDALGGTIVAESPVADGRGTRVTVSLPVPRPEPEPEPEPVPEARTATDPQASARA